VGRAGVPHIPPQLLDRGLRLGGGLPLQPGDHPGGDRQPEQVGGQLADRSFAEAIGPGEHAEDRDSALERAVHPSAVPLVGGTAPVLVRPQSLSRRAVGVTGSMAAAVEPGRLESALARPRGGYGAIGPPLAEQVVDKPDPS
jgi:hypothetical protein